MWLKGLKMQAVFRLRCAAELLLSDFLLEMNAAGRAQSRTSLTVMPLIAATYFMVAGGPYGLEELVEKTGFTQSIFILLLVPIIWSLPTALMVGELSSAIPEEGGFYAWVTR